MHQLPKHSVYFRNLLITKGNLTEHRLVYPFFHQAVHFAYSQGFLDPISHKIVTSVSDLAVVPCALLSLFLVRFSELCFFNFHDLRSKKRIRIHQPKTGKDKYYDNTFIFDALKNYHNDFRSPLICISYDNLRRQIQLAKRHCGLRMPKLCMDETHIFRHLVASYLNYLDVSMDSISKRLGHTDNQSTLSYIHDWKEISNL
jgi:Phage integrase family.